MAKLALRINGGNREIESADPDVPLLYVLRNDPGADDAVPGGSGESRPDPKLTGTFV